MPATPVVVALAILKQMAPVSWVPGVVISRNDARLSAEYSDRLVWVAEVGDRVKQGEVVARLNDSTARLDVARYQAEVSRESARLAFLEKEVRRLKTLSSSKNVSQSLLEESISDLEVSRNQLASNTALLELAQGNLRRTRILAPFDGIVTERILMPGEWAESGDLVLRLVDTGKLEAKAQVPIRLLSMVKLGDVLGVSGDGKQNSGTVRAIVPVGDVQSHLFDLRISVSSERWSTGDTVRVAVPTALPREALYRATVRNFLADNLPDNWESLAHGPGSEAQTVFSKQFCGALADAGLLVPHWPIAWGGRDADPWRAFILAEEMWAAGEPRGGQYMNVNWIGPTLMRFGSEQQQQRYIPPMARGETLWCQGFSEPEAGSDLASLRTRAERQGDHYRINGQKIWTSYAGAADTCFLLARTSAGKSGISIFLLPMDTRGITVRQIPSIIGEGDIHEVFFDDVDVPASAMLGEEGQAWEIVRSALSLERVGIPRFALASRMLHRAVTALKQEGRFAQAAIEQSAKAHAACEVARLYSYSIIDQRCHNQPPGPEASAARVATVNAERLVGEFVVEHMPAALAGGDALLLAHHQRAIVAGIASGAAEIQLNLVATELLQLPREPR